MKALTQHALLLALLTALLYSTVESQTITLQPHIKHQKMNTKGWVEAVLWVHEFVEHPPSNFYQNYPRYRDALNEALVETGVNRVRLEVRSGSENSSDWFDLWWDKGTISRSQWKSKRYEIINDNNDPFVINPAGFHFTELDTKIRDILKPLDDKLKAKNKHLSINLLFVDFGASPFELYQNSNEYAEFVLATFLHLRDKHNIIPDAFEIILEPDNASGWSEAQVADALVAAAERLKNHGFQPDIIAPSTANMRKCWEYFDRMIAHNPKVLQYIDELSYHRYQESSPSNLQKIAARAKQHGLGTSMLEWWYPDNRHHVLHEDLKIGLNTAREQGVMVTTNSNVSFFNINLSNPNNPILTPTEVTAYSAIYYKYIQPGAQRIGTSTTNNSFDSLAFMNPGNKYSVIIKAGSGGNISIAGLPAGSYEIRYTVSKDAPDVLGGQKTIAQGQLLSTQIPKQGVLAVFSTSEGENPPPPPIDPEKGVPPKAPENFRFD